MLLVIKEMDMTIPSHNGKGGKEGRKKRRKKKKKKKEKKKRIRESINIGVFPIINMPGFAPGKKPETRHWRRARCLMLSIV